MYKYMNPFSDKAPGVWFHSKGPSFSEGVILPLTKSQSPWAVHEVIRENFGQKMRIILIPKPKFDQGIFFGGVIWDSLDPNHPPFFSRNSPSGNEIDPWAFCLASVAHLKSRCSWSSFSGWYKRP